MLRSEGGTYVLIMDAAEAVEVRIGRLGTLTVQPGYYLYVGSAFGPGGLRARVGRHARTEGKKPHWHIDYLRPAVSLMAVWHTYDPQRREHAWAAILSQQPHMQIPLSGFGASDCTCPAHLFYTPRRPILNTFRQALTQQCKDHRPVTAWHI